MSPVALVYPNQLFKDHPALDRAEHFFLIEDPLFFSQYAFHKQKLILHRASMQFYREYLLGLGKKVTYIPSHELKHSGDLVNLLPPGELLVAELDDCWLERRLARAAQGRGRSLTQLTTPAFVTPLNRSLELFAKSGSYFMASFYREQRLFSDILVEKGKPVGGKWSFDSDNRKRLPKGVLAPALPKLSPDRFVKAAIESVNREFNGNPGDGDSFSYPVTFEGAEDWLDSFLKERFYGYGDYQDAIVASEAFLFHSVLSPLLNVGLLTPRQVLDRALAFADQNQVPLNSLEGFVRQVLGWREYVRAVYAAIGSKQRTTNFWGHQRKLPASFWKGDTGIAPVDSAIRKTLKFGYCHHIERLMVLGNFMLLCEFDPDQVYQWFMELFIDAYDWVMVPNVYGMSQYADGGLIVTKPYISSSNYIRKMSDFSAGPWCEIWDSLYWSFVNKYRQVFESNPRLKVMTGHLDRMGQLGLAKHREKADKFLANLG